MTSNTHQRVPALRFKQWLEMWDEYDFDPAAQRRKPEQYVYMFSMSAARLRQLCDVYKRERQGTEAEGIQRLRDPSRISRIQRYVRYGYPFGDLNAPQRTPDTMRLRKPGWLPTALVLNILIEGDERRGRSVRREDLIRIEEDSGGRYFLEVPSRLEFGINDLAPLEVIDGQHRLWGFGSGGGEESISGDFELPVEAFHGLALQLRSHVFLQTGQLCH